MKAFSLIVAIFGAFWLAKSDEKNRNSVSSVGGLIYYDSLDGQPYTSTYDSRSFFINGKRTLLLGGSIHYPRFSPGQWNDVLSKMRDDGLNHAEVYVFWNIHEPTYDFSGNHVYSLEGRANLTMFLDIAKQNGLFVNLRIGPYVCAEWAFGGLPVWLLHVNGISFRDANTEWENAMSTFITWVANTVEPYLAKNGGPIILAQIENEYHGSGTDGSEYVNWCGNFADSLNLEIPWVMCNGESANNTVNTCNGNDCYNSYLPTHSEKFPGQPLAWTENEGWFQYWGVGGNDVYAANVSGWANRSPEDMAFVVSKWFAGGAAHHNYYMYFGGNHVGWTAGSSISNYYADGVNYHGDCLANEPKHSHLSKLHYIIGQNQNALLQDNVQYGNEIYINPNKTSYFELTISTCDITSKLQQFKYDSNTNLLELSNGKYCAISTGNSDPIEMVKCDNNNNNQQWSYDNTNSLQIKSLSTSMCVDIFGEEGPNVDEWACKDPSATDAANQQWYYNETTKLFYSKMDSTKCLTANANNSNTFAYVYESRNISNGEYTNGEKLTFLVNLDESNEYTVEWEGINYYLPSESVSILNSDGEELFNSGTVDTTDVPTERVYKVLYSGNNGDLKFSSWSEEIPLTSNSQNRSDTPIFHTNPYEQIRFSNNTSEYLYYDTIISADFSVDKANLYFIGQAANAYNVWINDLFVGTTWNGDHGSGQVNFSIPMTNVSTDCTGSSCILTVLSSNLGIHNGIANQQGSDAQDKKGITGSIYLANNDKIWDNYTNSGWNHWIGSTGENLDVAGSGSNKVNWVSPAVTSNPMTWYSTTFTTPDMSLFYKNGDLTSTVSGVLLLDIGKNGNGMQRGHFWLNGIDMGHYNNVIQSNGVMVQQYYFIPLDYLMGESETNTLIFEEELPFNNGNSIENVNIVYSTFVIPQ